MSKKLCTIRLKKPKRIKRKKTKLEKAWHLLTVFKSGVAKHLTPDHPKIVKAAEVVGVGRAIAFLKRPSRSKDIMARNRRLPGSFQAHC
jgi:hypothetical protein